MSSIRKFSLWLASAFLGSFVVVDSIVALVALGKYHFNAAEMVCTPFLDIAWSYFLKACAEVDRWFVPPEQCVHE